MIRIFLFVSCNGHSFNRFTTMDFLLPTHTIVWLTFCSVFGWAKNWQKWSVLPTLLKHGIPFSKMLNSNEFSFVLNGNFSRILLICLILIIYVIFDCVSYSEKHTDCTDLVLAQQHSCWLRIIRSLYFNIRV